MKTKEEKQAKKKRQKEKRKFKNRIIKSTGGSKKESYGEPGGFDGMGMDREWGGIGGRYGV